MRAPWVPCALLVALTGCRSPQPAPEAPPAARVLLLFQDTEVVVRLGSAPPPGAWEIMDLGLWRPLPLDWSRDPRLGFAREDRVAPDRVLLRGPDGALHRQVVRDRPPVTRQAGRQESDALDPEDRDWLITVGLLWVLTLGRR